MSTASYDSVRSAAERTNRAKLILSSGGTCDPPDPVDALLTVVSAGVLALQGDGLAMVTEASAGETIAVLRAALDSGVTMRSLLEAASGPAVASSTVDTVPPPPGRAVPEGGHVDAIVSAWDATFQTATVDLGRGLPVTCRFSSGVLDPDADGDVIVIVRVLRVSLDDDGHVDAVVTDSTESPDLGRRLEALGAGGYGVLSWSWPVTSGVTLAAFVEGIGARGVRGPDGNPMGGVDLMARDSYGQEDE